LREYKETSLETEVQTTFYQISEALGKVTFPKIKRYPTVVLLRDFLEGDAIYHPVLGKYKFKKFLHENDIPIIARMTQDIAETFAPTQEMPKIAIILYRDDTKKDLDKEFVKLRKLIPSREYAFILSDLKTENEKNIAQLLSIQREDFPTLMIVKQEGSNLNRYIYRGQLEKNKMFTFFNDWKAGKILRTLKSDPEPEYSANQTIRNLVGKNFKREVFDNDLDVIVMFFSPTCPHCLELRPKYYNLANKYKNVKFNVFDATANEVEGINVDGYPMIMIYPSGKKDNPITKMGPNEEDIVSLLKEHCTLPLGEVVEPKKEEEKPKTEEAKQEDKPKTEEVKQEEKPKTEEVKEEEKPKVSETSKKDL
jgi:thiol-disulfide isomerase/thioredoxin